MKKDAFVIIGGILVPIIMAIAFGYWAWDSRLAFLNLYSFITNWEDFNLMAITLFASGFFAGISVVAIAMIGTARGDARKQREKQKLIEEVKKELEMEAQAIR